MYFVKPGLIYSDTCVHVSNKGYIQYYVQVCLLFAQVSHITGLFSVFLLLLQQPLERPNGGYLAPSLRHSETSCHNCMHHACLPYCHTCVCIANYVHGWSESREGRKDVRIINDIYIGCRGNLEGFKESLY